MPDRVALYLDYQNIHLTGRDTFSWRDNPYQCVPEPSMLQRGQDGQGAADEGEAKGAPEVGQQAHAPGDQARLEVTGPGKQQSRPIRVGHGRDGAFCIGPMPAPTFSVAVGAAGAGTGVLPGPGLSALRGQGHPAVVRQLL
jgi:hypothetical protein